MGSDPGATKRLLVYAALILLTLAHQDFWFWSDARLILGILPVGLAYHVAYTLAASVVLGLLVRFCWPRHLEEPAAPGGSPDGGRMP